jgi:glyoxylase-like metal-dependent hydrolase (beta-lactamase superfamily II)
MNRIRKISFYFILVTLSLFISCQGQTDFSIKIKRVNDKIIVFDYLSVNTTAISTPKGVVVIDTHRSPTVMLKIKEMIKQEFNRNDFVYVINTHGHWDHTSGNQVFPEATIIAQKNCAEYMKNNPANFITNIAGVKQRISKINKELKVLDKNSPKYSTVKEELHGWNIVLKDLGDNYVDTPPSLTFDERLNLDLGDMVLRLIYCGNSHTDNHIFIDIPEENVAFTGDIFTSKVNYGFPVNKLVDIPRIVNAITQISSISDSNKIIIPGHGDFLTGKDLIYLEEKLKEQYAELVDKKSAAKFLGDMIDKSGTRTAIRNFKKLISSKKNEYYFSEDEFSILGNRLLSRGKPDEAINVFTIGIELFPNSSIPFENLAIAYLKLGDDKSAIEYFEKSQSIFPDNGFIREILKLLKNNDTLSVAFWNLENLFDTQDDPDKSDEEFLPQSESEWTEERLDIKLNHLAKLIRSMNNGNGPDILGVCEVEHQSLLDTMIARYLNDKSYRVAYLESPDNRGIDNGLIYNANKFQMISVKGDTIHLIDNWPTRLILNVKLLSEGKDTLSVYVNHWPSRSRGQVVSEPNRIAAAITLRRLVKKEFLINPLSRIIIIGDFNDEPTNVSILDSLGAHPFICDSLGIGEKVLTAGELFNTSYQMYKDGYGSYKYKNDWNLLDQIIVSGSLITDPNLHYVCDSYEVYKPYFIITHSGKYEGTAFPTYGGRTYLGGYSDHFPVVSEFLIKGK